MFFKYLYGCEPIDEFGALKTIHEYLNDMYWTGEAAKRQETKIMQDVMEACYIIGKKHLKLWWEGDVKNGPFVWPILNNDHSFPDVAIVFKQDNNGTTFILSPLCLDNFFVSKPFLSEKI